MILKRAIIPMRRGWSADKFNAGTRHTMSILIINYKYKNYETILFTFCFDYH